MDYSSLQKKWEKFDQVFHPSLHRWGKFFSLFNIAWIIVLFVVPLALATPFFSEWSGCALADRIKSVTSRDVAMQICDWFALFSTLAIFVAIGGIAFTQTFADYLRDRVALLRDELITRQQQKDQELVKIRQSEVEGLIKTLGTPGNYWQKFTQFNRVMDSAVPDLEVISFRYLWFAMKGMGFYFPGGLYGLLGFMFLIVLVYALSGKIILDHLPQACRWE
jgi:hypothetical protein